MDWFVLNDNIINIQQYRGVKKFCILTLNPTIPLAIKHSSRWKHSDVHVHQHLHVNLFGKWFLINLKKKTSPIHAYFDKFVWELISGIYSSLETYISYYMVLACRIIIIRSSLNIMVEYHDPHGGTLLSYISLHNWDEMVSHDNLNFIRHHMSWLRCTRIAQRSETRPTILIPTKQVNGADNPPEVIVPVWLVF